MLAVQLGESANDLVAIWGKQGYRYGFPDFYAAEFPVRPMYYDQSRIYSGVIGRHYPNAKTGRYHYQYDPNMYLQPGAPTGLGDGGTSSTSPGVRVAIATGIALFAGVAGALAFSHFGQRAHR